MIEARLYSPALLAHTECLIRSLAHWTGRDLAPGVTDPVERARLLFDAPFVLVSHGTEADPILNYGNRAALALWETTWDELTRMPSRLTAEAPNRDERASARTRHARRLHRRLLGRPHQPRRPPLSHLRGHGMESPHPRPPALRPGRDVPFVDLSRLTRSTPSRSPAPIPPAP